MREGDLRRRWKGLEGRGHRLCERVYAAFKIASSEQDTFCGDTENVVQSVPDDSDD